MIKKLILILSLLFFVNTSFAAIESYNATTNSTSDSTNLDGTHKEINNLSIAATNIKTIVTISGEANINYTSPNSHLYGGIKKDGVLISTFNISSTNVKEAFSYSVSLTDTNGVHYYSFEYWSTLGKFGTIFNRTFIVYQLIDKEEIVSLQNNDTKYQNHSNLSNLTWSTSGHTIDSDIYMNKHDIFSIKNAYFDVSSHIYNLIELNANTIYSNYVLASRLQMDSLTPLKYVCSNSSDYLQSCDSSSYNATYEQSISSLNTSKLNKSDDNMTGNITFNIGKTIKIQGNSTNVVATTSNGGNTGRTHAYISYAKFLAPQNDILTGVGVYTDGKAINMRMALYNNTSSTNLPYKLLNETSSFAISTQGWTDVTILDTPIVSGETYWVAIQASSAANSQFYQSGQTGKAGYQLYTYGSYPATASATTDANPYMMRSKNTTFATYCINVVNSNVVAQNC